MISSSNYSLFRFTPILTCKIICFLFAFLGTSKAEDGGLNQFITDGTMVHLWLDNSSYPLEVIEYSDGLSEWMPISRNYGNGWESISPNAYDVYPADPVSVLILPQGNNGFFRKRYEKTISIPGNSALVSRFLMQATFGPTRSDIANFPNLATADLTESSYTSFESWIDQQIALPPFYHRAFWRQRSDPDYQDYTWRDGALPNEVGHDSSLGQRFAFYRGPTRYDANWNNPLPGYGGFFDIDGNPIDPSDHAGNLDYAGVPKIGLHAENSIRHKGHVWDVSGLGWGGDKKAVWYEAAINAEDQLRQRVAWALSQYFVVGEAGSGQEGTTERWLNYYDIFVRNAFGNFRDILSEVTWSPHMGNYLSYIENKKADPSKGTFPDENYAREVMQLFTIGLWELNEDGTLELNSNGKGIPTYSIEDVAEFAKVFTGLRRPGDRSNIEVFFGNYVDPMRIQPVRHDFSTKTLLDGTTLGPFPNNKEGVRSDVKGLLDHLFEHKNLPPFFAKFMIQRFTVSNPSPSYIQSVSSAFKSGLYNGVGSGNRGDMAALIKAILLHPEARSHRLSFDPIHGKLREPLIRLMHLCRSFNLESNRVYEWICFKNLGDSILQAPYEQSSVFNFYSPSYSPNGTISDMGLSAPEFQISNDVSALKLLNHFNLLIDQGLIQDPSGDFGSRWYVDANLDFSYEVSLSYDIDTLISWLDLIMCGGALGESTKVILIDAMNATGEFPTDYMKVKYLIFLISMTVEFNTLY